MDRQPKTDAEWLAESADSVHLTKIKVSIIGQIALARNNRYNLGQETEVVDGEVEATN